MSIFEEYEAFKGMNKLSGETTLSKLFFLPFEKWSTLKERICSQFFSFREDPFSGWDWCTGKQT